MLSNVVKAWVMLAFFLFLSIFGIQRAGATEAYEQIYADFVTQYKNNQINKIEGKNSFYKILRARHPMPKGKLIIMANLAYQNRQLHELTRFSDRLRDSGWHVILAYSDLLNIHELSELPVDQENSTNDSSNAFSQTNEEQSESTESNQNQSSVSNEILAVASTQTAKAFQSDFSAEKINQCAMRMVELFNDVNAELNTGGLPRFVVVGDTLAACAVYADLTQISGLIVNNPAVHDVSLNSQLVRDIVNVRWPILDINVQQQNLWAASTSSDRRMAMKAAAKSQYRQRNITLSGVSQLDQDQLAGEVVGWLTYLGY